MGYIVVLVFVITILLAFIEPYMKKYKAILYLFIGMVLILIAGLREVGIDPDSRNYEYTYLHYDSPLILEGVEITYLYLSKFFNNFTHDVHIIFLLYALMGLGLKFIAFRKLSEFYFLPVVVYISYYYIMHECMQIRTGVLSGLLLFYIKAIGDNNKRKAIIYLLIGTTFHYSALLLAPFLFIKTTPLEKKRRWIWGCTIPIAYAITIVGFSILFIINSDIPFIGNKLAIYQEAQEKGMADNSINIYSPLNLFSILLYYYMLYFYETIAIKNKYFPLMMRILTIAIVFHVMFSFFPVLAVRTYMLFSTITILMYTYIYYTIRPKWAAILVVSLIAFVYLNYAIPNISFHILWNPK